MVGPEIAERATQECRPSAEPDLLFHGVILLLAIGTLVGSLVFRIQDGEQVLLPLLDVPVPGTCTYKRLVGTDCPGCGLTRCFISLAQGDLRGAWDFNPAGILVFLVVILQIPYRALQLWRAKRGLSEIRLGRVSSVVLWILMAALLIQWLCRTVLPEL